MPKAFYKPLLEIACFNIESCVIAQEAGADRIEFCVDYKAGGITPTQKDILEARKLIHIPLHVIIRPRGGNFFYNVEEIETMKHTVLFCKENNIDGVVFGVLNSDQTIDLKTNKELLQLAKPMSITFHRAIDKCPNMETAFDEIIRLGFNKVLTSGGKQNASEEIENLKKYQAKFGEKIIIIPAGGIRSENINHIMTETKTKEIHSAAITTNDARVNAGEIKRLKEKMELFIC